MKTFRMMVVEDEMLIAELLSHYLIEAGHEVVGIAISYEEAEKMYLLERPDLVLLDIRLSGKQTGIDFGGFIQRQQHPVPFIYLTSQLDDKNIQAAKKTLPAAYLPKPVHQTTLNMTIEMTMHKYLSQQPVQEKKASIIIMEGSEKHVVTINDILFLRGEHIYVRIHLQNGKQLLPRTSLSKLMEDIPTDHFLQIHRSYIVNLQHVNSWNNDQVFIEDYFIPISRSRLKEVSGILIDNVNQ